MKTLVIKSGVFSANPLARGDKRQENMRKIQEALEKLPPRRKNEP